MTDDQRVGTYATMPTLRHQIIARGRTYRGVAPTSICCPVRTSLFSGNFSHTTRIYTNVRSRHGGWYWFHRTGQERHTLARALHRHGYRTGLFGKYLNGWGTGRAGYVPPGWDVFRGMQEDDLCGEYYDYWIKGTGSDRWYGTSPQDYSTDVTSRLAARFVRGTPSTTPFFVVWAPRAPHLPATPAPRDVGSWSASSPYQNRAVNERNMTDKPRMFQALPPMDPQTLAWIRDQSMESLRAVDDGLGRLLAAIDPRRLSNTIVIYTSDQGYLWGEHRMATKYVPYKWATDYPLIVRWDGHVSHGSSRQLVPTVDITAAILRATDASIRRGIDGRSFLTSPRHRVVLEGVGSPLENTDGRFGHPGYCGVRTRRYMYVDWSGRVRAELYDYRSDPLELRNRAGVAWYHDVQVRLHRWAVHMCNPPPPRFHW